MIEAVFELDDVPVNRLMTPRPDIFSLPIDLPWDELLAQCHDARYSRVPIWEDDPDNILGVLLIKDLLRYRRHKPDLTALRKLLLSPVWVPGTKPASEMMREMITRRLHIAFVADEHGSLVGLISLDDLIVELVGELGEEDDDETADVDVEGNGTVTANGGVDIEDFVDSTGIEVPEGDYHTLGGFVFHTLGRVPRTGDAFDANGARYEVLQMDGRRVSLVRIHRTPQEGASA
jgi:CBS domain containing-hemolysin-like protein